MEITIKAPKHVIEQVQAFLSRTTEGCADVLHDMPLTKREQARTFRAWKDWREASRNACVRH